LAPKDPLWRYSDAAFHELCFAADRNAGIVEQVFDEWHAIYDSRPPNLATDQERSDWLATVRRSSAGISVAVSVLQQELLEILVLARDWSG